MNTTFRLLRILVGSLALAVVLISAFLWYANRTPVIGDNFTLRHLDSDWELKQKAKPLNILYVGYAKCPDVCPLSLSFSAQAFRQLSPKEQERVQLIFISVDHEHDTPQAVAEYASQFFPAFIGLTGSKEQIDKAIAPFGASYMLEKSDSYLGYSIAHTDKLFFLDRDGHVLDTIPFPRSSELILEKIKEHI